MSDDLSEFPAGCFELLDERSSITAVIVHASPRLILFNQGSQTSFSVGVLQPREQFEGLSSLTFAERTSRVSIQSREKDIVGGSAFDQPCVVDTGIAAFSADIVQGR